MVHRSLLRAASDTISATASIVAKAKTRVCYLDLRGSGLSVLERLLLEECILQQDPADRHWVICGNHEPVPHKHLRGLHTASTSAAASAAGRNGTTTPTAAAMDAAWNVDATGANDSVAIVLGIGGKAELLLNVNAVKADRVPTIKRFSGGGTVVLDYNSLWTTVIGRRDELVAQPHFPRPVMQYTADCLYGPMFQRLAAMQKHKATISSSSSSSSSSSKMDRDRAGQKLTMVLDTKSCGAENTGRLITVPHYQRVDEGRTDVNVNDRGYDDDANNSPQQQQQQQTPAAPAFRLRENDYVMGERKMGGNAQAIGKTGWLHHTSFLWDYQAANMEYLTLPSKRPEYRGDRSHADFLVKLHEIYPNLSKADFFAALAETCEQEFDVERVTVREAMKIVDAQGGMKAWFQTKSRTKVLTDV